MKPGSHLYNSIQELRATVDSQPAISSGDKHIIYALLLIAEELEKIAARLGSSLED